MGKGDRKTKKGKIVKGSFGKSRPQRARNQANYTGSEIKVNIKKAQNEEE